MCLTEFNNWLANDGIKGNAMKVKTTVHIYHTHYSWEKKAKFQVFSLKMDDTEHYTYIGEQEIEIEVPNNYDPRAQKIAALQARKQKVMADYQKTVTEINARISELQAIEHTA
jgi:poly(3-hydroxybutyrate) depolymerase